MKKSLFVSLLSFILLLAWAWPALAQAPTFYGLPINLETAKKVAAPAIAEASKKKWTMAVGILDQAGAFLPFHFSGRLLNGSYDPQVGPAAAEVIGHPVNDVLFCGLGIFRQ